MFDVVDPGWSVEPAWDWNARVQLYLSGKEAERLGLFVTIDAIDYDWAMQWKWNAKRSQDRGNPKHKVKWYAYRKTRIMGRDLSIFLHKQICERHRGLPPTKRHIIADHQNGHSLDCWRDNLDWATPSMNRENYHGFYALQLKFSFGTKSMERLERFQEFGKILPLKER
jgi:hypothetical protein